MFYSCFQHVLKRFKSCESKQDRSNQKCLACDATTRHGEQRWFLFHNTQEQTWNIGWLKSNTLMMKTSTAKNDLEVLALVSASAAGVDARVIDGKQRRSAASRRDHYHVRRRLFLLEHASWCADGCTCAHDGCIQTQSLLEHMAVCRDEACAVPGCRSGRALRDHYRRCAHARCFLCAPVRQALGDEYWGGTWRNLAPALCVEYFSGKRQKLRF